MLRSSAAIRDHDTDPHRGLKRCDGFYSLTFTDHNAWKFGMTIFARQAFAAACVGLIVVGGLVGPAAAQQPLAAGAVRAQVQPGPTMGSEMMERGRMRPGIAGPGMGDGGTIPMMMGSGTGHTEGRLAYIKAELKITDVQMPQWNAFADAVRANVAAMADLHRSVASNQRAGVGLPERLAFEDKLLSAHFAAVKKSHVSLIKLYDVLSLEQKKLADGIVIGFMGIPIGMT